MDRSYNNLELNLTEAFLPKVASAECYIPKQAREIILNFNLEPK